MKKIISAPRFEVDFKTRLEQSRTASDAVRLPRLGYHQYRVYDLEKKKDKSALNNSYGIRKGPMHVIAAGGKAYHYMGHSIYQIFMDELDALFDPPRTVKWLKPKQVTVLRLKGHRVEEL